MGTWQCLFASFSPESDPIHLWERTRKLVSQTESIPSLTKFSCDEKENYLILEKDGIDDEIKKHFAHKNPWTITVPYLDRIISLSKIIEVFPGKSALPLSIDVGYYMEVPIQSFPATWSSEDKDKVLDLGLDLVRELKPTRLAELDSANFEYETGENELWLVYYQDIQTLSKVACEIFNKEYREPDKDEAQLLTKIARENSYKLELINGGLFILSSEQPADYPDIQLPHQKVADFFEKSTKPPKVKFSGGNQ